ncbi:MAG: ABC transporter permease subunit [Chloroflexi bacterium]|nr:MAG: ABC transporter permease subunit [Chloroflexota bacterium]
MAREVSKMAQVVRGTNLPGRGQIYRAHKPARRRFGLDKILLTLVLLYLTVPLGATLAFGLSIGSGFKFNTFMSAFTDPDFSLTLTLSLGLAFATTLLTVLVPFAVPAIVMAFGLVEVYGTGNTLVNVLSFGLVPLLSNEPFNVVNTPQLLVCAYVIVSLPFVYRPIDNNLRAINTKVLSEAAYSLGSGWWRTFLTIIFPNILPGVISAALLTFSTVMGEFTLASLFGIYTFPIYLNATGQSDAHKAASLTILSFFLTMIFVLGIILLVRIRPGRPGTEDRLDIVATK